MVNGTGFEMVDNKMKAETYIKRLLPVGCRDTIEAYHLTALGFQVVGTMCPQQDLPASPDHGLIRPEGATVDLLLMLLSSYLPL